MTIATAIAIVLPFVIYFIERRTGALPSSQEYWATSGSNHGPWRYSFEGLLIMYPLLVLIAVTAVRAIKSLYTKENKEWFKFPSGIILILIQCAGIVLQLYLLLWTID